MKTTATQLGKPSLSCMYCDSADLIKKFLDVPDRLGYVPGSRDWWQCQECKSVLTVPQPKSEELANFYPPVYSFTQELRKKGRIASMLAALEYRFMFRPQYRMQERQLQGALKSALRGKKLLDIGAGRGLRLIEFQRAGFDVHAIDLQEDAVRYLRDELQIPAVCADVAHALDHYAEGSFDVVTAYQLMEHVLDVNSFLRSCFQLVRPGGWVAIACPFIDSLQASLFRGKWINVTEAPRHVSLPTKRGAQLAMTRAGFVDVTVRPDALLNSAGVFAISLITNASFTHAYGRPGIAAYIPRIIGAAVMIASLPFCAFESYLLRRPSVATIYARKPLS